MRVQPNSHEFGYEGDSGNRLNGTMSKIRILIVDDAVVVRRLVADLLSGDPALEVAGTAANGRIALSRIDQLQPDLVLLDVEMPEMDGLQTLATLRKTHPALPVIMLSRFTSRGAATTLDALALGANDYVAMPDGVRNLEEALRDLGDRLIPKIKQFARPGRGSKAALEVEPPPTPRNRSLSDPGLRPRSPLEIVAVGASTGGPNALALLMAALPADFPVPVVMVQHMPPLFTRLLAERLTAQGTIPVSEAVPGELVRAGRAWLAPGDHHLELAQEGISITLRTHQGPAENSCRPSVDVLLRSVVEVYGAGALVVMLTGMGQDGLRGCERVRAAGGQILAQDEATSVVWGMPGVVARAGLADQVLPLDQLGAEVVRRVRKGRTTVLSAQKETVILRRHQPEALARDTDRAGGNGSAESGGF
jgi:two-component system chemotaxis response regulator CheB